MGIKHITMASDVVGEGPKCYLGAKPNRVEVSDKVFAYNVRGNELSFLKRGGECWFGSRALYIIHIRRQQ